MENYRDSISALATAARQDPTWLLVRQKLESTRLFLKTMNEMIVAKVPSLSVLPPAISLLSLLPFVKGKLKAKRLSAITSDLLAQEKAFTGKESITRVSGLKEGDNDTAVFIGAVVATVTTTDYIPL